MIRFLTSIPFPRLSIRPWAEVIFLWALRVSPAGVQTHYHSFADGGFSASPVWGGCTADRQVVVNSNFTGLLTTNPAAGVNPAVHCRLLFGRAMSPAPGSTSTSAAIGDFNGDKSRDMAIYLKPKRANDPNPYMITDSLSQ